MVILTMNECDIKHCTMLSYMITFKCEGGYVGVQCRVLSKVER